MNVVVEHKNSCINIGMGVIVKLEDQEIGRTVLGSCIGLVLYCEQKRLAAMAHIVLPASNSNDTSTPGKFADTAVPEMLRLLANQGVKNDQLIAKIAGGASMFKATGRMEIGKANTKAVADVLKHHQITIAGQVIGGKKGRKVTFHPSTGDLFIEQAGSNPVVI